MGSPARRSVSAHRVVKRSDHANNSVETRSSHRGAAPIGSATTCAARLPVKSLYLEAEAPPHPADRTRDAPSLRRRASHRSPQERASHGFLHHRHGDANNAILAAVGYSFRLLIKWLRILLCRDLRAAKTSHSVKNNSSRTTNLPPFRRRAAGRVGDRLARRPDPACASSRSCPSLPCSVCSSQRLIGSAVLVASSIMLICGGNPHCPKL
jgi:hypothetical protein